MGKHEVNPACLGCQVIVDDVGVLALVFGIGQQALEITDIALNGRAEGNVTLIAPGYLIKSCLALRRVELPVENVTFAVAEALPYIARGILVDSTGDIIETQFSAWLGLRRVEGR